MAPQIRRKSNGRHETGPQTVPDAPAEEPMTTPAPSASSDPSLDDALDDLLDAFERATQRAEIAGRELPEIEKQIREAVAYGDRLRGEAHAERQQAADWEQRAAAARDSAKGKDEEADSAFRGVEMYGKQRQKLLDLVARHQATAARHRSAIERETANGATDPRTRRQRPQSAPAPSQPGFQPSVLDGPNPPVPQEPTAPFPQHQQAGIDDPQKTQAVGGGAP